MVNAFSQLGNIAGSYVWGLEEDGFRKSYGIVTAMFGLTIIGCWIFRTMLIRLNKKLDAGELPAGWETHPDVVAETARVEGYADESAAVKLRTTFRYMI